jgi:hypothetical protein
MATGHLTDKRLGAHSLLVADALLVDYRQRCLQHAGYVARPLCVAYVGREYGDFGEVTLLEVVCDM